MIFQHLDSSDFRRQPSLLRLSKEWYSLARPVLYRDMSFNLSTILRIGRGRARFLKTLPELMQQYTLTIHVIIYFPKFSDDSRVDALTALSGIYPEILRLSQYQHRVEKGMSQLGDILKRSLNLRQITFEMQTGVPFRVHPGIGFTFLMAWPFPSLSLFSNLSTLYIDIVGCSFYNFHLCSVIGQVLPHLRSLRCRFCWICPDILNAPLDAGDLGLGEVIINLSIVPDSEWQGGEEASLCRSFQDANPEAQLHIGLYDAASRLARRMKKPSMLRIIESSFTGYDFLARKPISFGGHFNIGIQDWDKMLVEVSENDEDTDRGGLMTEEEEVFDTELWEDEESLDGGDEIDHSAPEGADGGQGKTDERPCWQVAW